MSWINCFRDLDLSVNLWIFLNLSLLSRVTWPLQPISNGVIVVLYVSLMSVWKWLYPEQTPQLYRQIGLQPVRFRDTKLPRNRKLK